MTDKKRSPASVPALSSDLCPLFSELYVWIYPPKSLAPVLCGTLTLLGGRVCPFSYSDAWLGYSGAFALSPDLPLRAGLFEPPSKTLIHPVFEDATPDRWGRRVIDKIFKLQRRSELDYLAVAGEDRIGALGFSLRADEYTIAPQQALYLADLAELLLAAQAIERRLPVDENMRQLLCPAATAGGTRPKAVIQEGSRRWIAKFPTEDDSVEVCAIEYASLALARECGIMVPDARLVEVGRSRVLLVERFDRAVDHSRIHFCSARTLLMAQGLNAAEAAYADLADTVRRWSHSPKPDAQKIYRRMLFNILIENTDDHEKNHGFLWQAKQWNLAPAYDIQPQLQGIHYQQLRVGKAGSEPTITNALSERGRFMLSGDEVRDELDTLLSKAATWRTVFERATVSKSDIEECARYLRIESAQREWAAIRGQKEKKNDRH